MGNICNVEPLQSKETKLEGYAPELTSAKAFSLLNNSPISNNTPFLFKKVGEVGLERIKDIVGASYVNNQLVDTNTTSVTIASGHKYVAKISGTLSVGQSSGSAISVTGGTDTFTDLTQLFGSASIADYIYSLETATAGAGIAKLKELGFDFSTYRAYDAGSIVSVNTSGLKVVGFNQWDEVWENGYINASGNNASSDRTIRSKNYIPIIGGADYYLKCPVGSNIYAIIAWYDANKTFLYRQQYIHNEVVTAPSNGKYLRFNMFDNYGSTYNNDICINISDPNRNGQYEPYTSKTTPLSPIDLRGLYKIDANNNIYADGDTYKPSGDVSRKYGIIDLSTVNSWSSGAVNSTTNMIRFNVAISDKAYGQNMLCNRFMSKGSTGYDSDNYESISGSDGSNRIYIVISASRLNGDLSTEANRSIAFKSWIASNSTSVIYPLATPTAETAKPFPEYINIYQGGTEEFIDTRALPAPVGHNSDLFEVNAESILSNKQDKVLSEPITVESTEYLTVETALNAINNKKANVSDVEELQAYIGYSSTDIIGVEVDYVNKSFRRLGAAVGKNGGSDFDVFPMFGGRRRCNVADDGTISKYYGDTGYAEDGSNGQVMVYQPKFYYKVVPLKLEKQSTGKGYHIRKAAYYVTATPMKGFKVHPAFVNASGNEVDYILVGASKGCIYDVSESTYVLDDAQVMDNTADKFSSIFGVKPASGLTQDLTRPKIEQMCQNRGANWHELNVQMASMTQLLMLIEYGKFDMQRAIGKGVVDITDNSSYNCGATSGSTSALGNASGRATSTTIVTNTSTTYTDDGKTSITYRGEEDSYGDMWEFVMGMNIYGNGSMNGGEPYICSDYNYAESKNTGNYKGAGFTVANTDGYVNAWGYGSEDFDWLFIASEVGGSNALPVGDYLWRTANLNGYQIALLGADWSLAWSAGGFCWFLAATVRFRYRSIAGRLAYIPA